MKQSKENRGSPSFVGLEVGVSMGEAFQVEGLPRFSDWYDWTHQPGKILDYSNADEAGLFFKNFETDIGLAKELGAKVFKFSVAWDRVEPQPGEWDQGALSVYVKIVESIQSHGLLPVIGLQSAVLPRWMAKLGGLCSDDFPHRFSVYCAKVVECLAPHTHDKTRWLTFSRPLTWVSRSLGARIWPPGNKDYAEMLLASSHIVRAHYLAVEKMREKVPRPLHISFMQAVWELVPSSWYNPFDWLMLLYFRRRMNLGFYRAIRSGKNLWRLPGVRTASTELPELRNGQELDFVALSFDGVLRIRFKPLPPFLGIVENKEVSEDWWLEKFDKKLMRILSRFRAESVPLELLQLTFPSSNDEKRSLFLRSLAKVAREFKNSGWRIGVWLYGPFTDCFEWEKGFSLKRGLVSLSPGGEGREKKESYLEMQKLLVSEAPRDSVSTS